MIKIFEKKEKERLSNRCPYCGGPIQMFLERGRRGAKTQHSGFAGERRSGGMRKPCRSRQGERYGACDDGEKELGASSSGYGLIHEKGFPTPGVGNRIMLPKDAFIQWAARHTNGGTG